MESRLDVNVLARKHFLYLGPVFFDNHQAQSAIVLNVPGTGNQLEPHTAAFQDRLRVHRLVGGVEQKDKMLVGQGQMALRSLRGHIRFSRSTLRNPFDPEGRFKL